MSQWILALPYHLDVEMADLLMVNGIFGYVVGEWRLENDKRVLVASNDEKPKIEREISCLEGPVLHSFEVMTLALDAVLTFEQKYTLRIFSISFEETEDNGMDSWRLYTPDEGNVIVIHADETFAGL